MQIPLSGAAQTHRNTKTIKRTGPSYRATLFIAEFMLD